MLENNIEYIHKESCSQQLPFDFFLKEWDETYLEKVKKIDIFIPQRTAEWSQTQKVFFAKVFYHARGHFHDFLWLLGNFAEDKETKEIVIKNISEEFNSTSLSHEQMYFNFAESLGVDLEEELVEGHSYLSFVQEFNKGHLRWLKSHDASERFAAFSAYERLDNLDYGLLWEFAQSLGISNKDMLFFKVHMRATHFQTTENKLNLLWNEEPEKVKEAYEFIAKHQLNMWQNLSQAIFNHA